MIIPDNSTVVSFITRDKSGFKVLNPDYRLYLKDNTKHLISGKKKLASVGSDFMICTAPRSGWRPPEENIGTMSSNFPGSVYNIFKKPYGISYWKQELIATVKFTNNLTLEPAPRKFGVYLLKEGIKYFDLEGHKND